MYVLHALSPAKRVGETGREMMLADANSFICIDSPPNNGY